MHKPTENPYAKGGIMRGSFFATCWKCGDEMEVPFPANPDDHHMCNKCWTKHIQRASVTNTKVIIVNCHTCGGTHTDICHRQRKGLRDL